MFVAALAGGSAVAAAFAWDSQVDRADRKNREQAGVVAAGARAAVVQITDTMRAGEAIVDDNGRMPPDRFGAFTREVLRRSSFPALAWAPHVDGADRAAYERRAGNEIQEFKNADRLGPRQDAKRYLPIELIEPPSARRSFALGYDLLSTRERAEALEAALEIGDPALSPPLRTLLERESGAAVVDPLYDRGAPTRRPDQRRAALIGVLVAGISGDAIARAVRTQAGVQGPVSITDGSRIIVAEPGLDDAVSFTIAVLGRRWTVSSPRASEPSPASALAFGAGGIAITLLASGLLWAAGRRERDLARRRADAERRAARDSLMTRIAEKVEVEVGFEERLGALARTMVPAVGDVCVVHAVTASGAVRRAGVAAVDPGVEQELRDLAAVPLTSPVYAAIESGEPVLYTRFAGGGMDTPPTVAGITGVRSNMIVPLVAREQVLGTLSLSVLHSTGRDAFSREDLAFATEVASHAAVALDNARLYEQQLGIAQVLQRALLPRSLPRVEGAEVAASHRPGLAWAEMGGDFYDLFQVNGHWMAVVGDVCGKGPEAAAMTALVRHTLRATAGEGAPEAVQRVHEAIKTSGETTYCTLCCAEIEAHGNGLRAKVVTAGHPEPRVVTRAGGVRRLDVTGPLVGAFDAPCFEAQELDLAQGDLLFMCSDGIPEARHGTEVFGDVRLERLLGKLASLPAELLIERLEAEIVNFVEGRPRDDLALFALRAN